MSASPENVSNSPSDSHAPASPVVLRRSLGLFALTVYGVGDILGAGIYALVGKVSGTAGVWSWASFVVSVTVAALTALAYCELVTRLPRSGGEATYALSAFRQPWLAFLVGWMVFCSGVFSLSSVAHACANYVQGLAAGVPAWPVWILFLAAVALLNFRGIQQSSSANIVFTLIEFSGLLLVIVVGAVWFLNGDGQSTANVAATSIARGASDPSSTPPISGMPVSGILSGAAIAFFAFIGFEDMINVAEEVREPECVFPKAILLAVSICGTVYIAVTLAALAVLSPAQLAASEAPLLAVVQRAAPWVPGWLYTAIALVAVSNTGLLNSIMASRLIYGMSTQGLLPRGLSRIHRSTRTPHFAVLAIFAVGLLLVFSGTLSQLAATTSFLLLLVFVVVNASLVAIRWQSPAPAIERTTPHSRQPASHEAAQASSKAGQPLSAASTQVSSRGSSTTFRIPLPVPMIAAATCLGLVCFVEPDAILTGLSVMACGAVLATLAQRRGVDWEAFSTQADQLSSQEPR